MDEQTFRKYMGLARASGGDYAGGYITGLRRHYHGDRFELPASAQQLSDTTRYGARAEGFRDGIEGHPPREVNIAEMMTSIYIDLPTSQKARYVRAAQRADMKLVPWIIETLDKSIEQGAGANDDR